MFGRLIASYITLAALSAVADNPAPDPLGIYPILSAMHFPGVTAPLVWDSCGEPNAFYWPAERKVVLCTELYAMPHSFIRFATAHEYAHAVIHQLNIPITGSEEVAADELAAIILVTIGDKDDLYEVSNLFFRRGYPEIPWDPHPGDVRRALNLGCLAAGSQGMVHPFCSEDWRVVVKTWNQLLFLRGA